MVISKIEMKCFLGQTMMAIFKLTRKSKQPLKKSILKIHKKTVKKVKLQQWG